jgi:hypothetical protein
MRADGICLSFQLVEKMLRSISLLHLLKFALYARGIVMFAALQAL